MKPFPLSSVARLPVSAFNWLGQGGPSSTAFTTGSAPTPVQPMAPLTTTSVTLAKDKMAQEVVSGVSVAQLLQAASGKPARPANAFSVYCKEQGFRPGKDQTSAAEKWKLMTDQEKNRYTQVANRDLTKYRQEMKKYNEIMGQTITLDRVASLLKSTLPKSAVSRPPRKISAYCAFLRDQLKGRQGKPDLQAVGLQWKSLSPSEKSRYQQMVGK